MDTVRSSEEIATLVETQPINRIVEVYPVAMPYLSAWGIDICCGGGHTVREAARLHSLDADQVVDQVTDAIHQDQS